MRPNYDQNTFANAKVSFRYLFCSADSHDKITWMSDSSIDFLGAAPQDIVGLHVEKIFPRIEPPPTPGQSNHWMAVISRPDGSNSIVEMRRFTVSESDRFAGHTHLASRMVVKELDPADWADLCSKKKDVAEVSSATETIFSWQTAGEVTDYDELFARYFGIDNRSQSQQQGAWADPFVHVGDQELAAIQLQLAQLTPAQPLAHHTYYVHTDTGNYYQHERIDRAVFNPQLALQGFHSIARVVSEGHRLPHDPQELVDNLSKWLGVVIHELRQPLQLIQTTAERLETVAGKRPTVDSTKVVDAAADIVDAASMANSILEHHQPLVKKPGFNPQPCRIGDVFDTALQTMRPQLDDSRVQIEVVTVPENAIGLLDPTLLYQLLVNLLANALDSLNHNPPDDRKIKLSVRKYLASIEIRVKDNGPGLSEGSSSNPFQIFKSSKPEHLGVGLAICQQIAELHGGEIWYEPAPSGSIFRIEIPQGTSSTE